MGSRSRALLALGIAAFVVSAAHVSSQQAPPAAAQRPVDFATDVRPILAESCFACHSGDRPMGQLRLDVRSLAMKGGVSGPIILPGKSAESGLVHRVLGSGGQSRMPMGRPPLAPEQIATLTRWIDEGAPWPDALANEANATLRRHWAYVKPVRPAPPPVQGTAWIRNPIDRFVLARLEKEGLRPSPEASRETLIRRLSLDLTGLPPTPAEIDAFVGDTRADAYERLVDRLLASPHYGERMATPWLDQARYADSNGFERDYQRVAWPYRDWVVKAFNDNKPFDQFTIEQIAGDLLPNATTAQQVATGFVRASMLNTEGGTDPDEQFWLGLIDRATTVGNVFLGSTVQCAQCHNHKYDPFTQKQFYQMVAFFDNAKTELGAGGGPMDYRSVPEMRLLLPNEQQALRCEQIDGEYGLLTARLNADTAEFRQFEAKWEESVRAAEATWRPLQPTSVASQKGSQLTRAADNSILVSGANPENEVYTVAASIPEGGRITGIRIEALPDASLPMNGPGRDPFGNFVVDAVKVEVGPVFSEVPVDLVADNARGTRAGERQSQSWRSGLAEAERRVPMTLLAIPKAPIVVSSGGLLRVALSHSGPQGAALGRFRLSVTTTDAPRKVTEITYRLRPLLGLSAQERLAYAFQRDVPEAQQNAGGRAIKLSDSLCGRPSFTFSQPPADPNQPRTDPVFEHWRTIAPELAEVRGRMEALRTEVAEMRVPSALVLAENTAVEHPKTYIHERGLFTVKMQQVASDVPDFLGSLPAGVPPNRLGLAKWLVSPDNPLTARVRVNQIWQTIFGMGIVETAEDFGTQGFAPSHPELLDWLATELVANKWDQKALIRLIVGSNTYRQSSDATPQAIERDPKNALLGRGARYRVEAEMVRDIALSVSGLLSQKMGGPPVMPPQPAGLWSFPVAAPNDNWVESQGEERYRRGLYTFIRRTVRYPSLLMFDAPSREVTIARRSRSNTPFQALTLMNDPVFFEIAQTLARRVQKEGGSDTRSRLAYGFRLATSRKPTESELKLLLANFDEQRRFFATRPKEATDVSGAADPDAAALVMVSNSLVNLNETITRK